LCITRQEILAYLKTLGQEFVTDSTNLQDEYVRNKIRLQIIPQLEKINPQVGEKIFETIRHLREVETIYRNSIEEAIQRVTDDTQQIIHIPSLLAEVEPRAVLFEILRNRGFVSAQIDDIFRSITAESGKCFTNKKWQILKDRDTLLIRPNRVEEKRRISIPHAPSEILLSNASVLKIKRLPHTPEYSIPRTPDVATLDAAQVEFPLTIRPWERGDKFAPFGMKGRKKLVSDLLTDLKLTLFEKEAQLVMTDAHDRILWVIGRRTDERTKVTERTREIIELRIK
jgi:tRNA(Ile)-lysidine synthase